VPVRPAFVVAIEPFCNLWLITKLRACRLRVKSRSLPFGPQMALFQSVRLQRNRNVIVQDRLECGSTAVQHDDGRAIVRPIAGQGRAGQGHCIALPCFPGQGCAENLWPPLSDEPVRRRSGPCSGFSAQNQGGTRRAAPSHGATPAAIAVRASGRRCRAMHSCRPGPCRRRLRRAAGDGTVKRASGSAFRSGTLRRRAGARAPCADVDRLPHHQAKLL
jgi:hypothetical protein